MKTRLEIENIIGPGYDVCMSIDITTHVPVQLRDNYVPTGKCLHVFDDVGNRVAVIRGYKPINGGVVLYSDSGFLSLLAGDKTW